MAFFIFTCLLKGLLAVFTLETDYPSETCYPLDNTRKADNTPQFRYGTVLVFAEQSAGLYPSVHPSILTDFEDGLSFSDG